MLKNHLSLKYLNHNKNADLSSIVPTTPRDNGCCFEKALSPPLMNNVRSPDYKRKKIFENTKSPQSKLTGKFASLTQSTVEPYPVEPTSTQNIKQIIKVQVQTFKKKLKTNKENGLTFDKKHTNQLKRLILKKTIHLKSQGNIQENISTTQSIRNENDQNTFRKNDFVNSKCNYIELDESRMNLLKQEEIRLKEALNRFQFSDKSSVGSLIIQEQRPQSIRFSFQKETLKYSKTNYQEQYMQESFPKNNFIKFPFQSFSKPPSKTNI